MSAGLYGLDEATKQLLKVENFEKEFSPKEFIEQLSKNHAGIGALSEALDPKPYIRTFEAALAELQGIQDYTKSVEQDAANEVQQAELEHSRNVANLGRTIDGTMTDFGILDGLIGDIGAATSTLSDKLERLALQHELASSSGFLIDCYLSFATKGNCPELERFWQGPSIARRRCANVIRQLQTLSKRLEGVKENKKAQMEIDKFAEMLENDLLKHFNDAYAKADMAVMKESADILTDFNGGKGVTQSFVNQHDFFIEVNQMVGLEEEDQGIWERLSDLDNDGAEFEGILQKITDDILEVAHTEMEIIRKVFRDPVSVLKVFLQRIFAQRIEDRLDNYLSLAERVSLLAYVRALHIAYGKVSMLVKNLKEAASQADLDNDGELAAMLDQNFADVFIIRIENGKYFERESRSLMECIDAISSRFRDAHAKKKETREQSMFGRFTSTLDSNSAKEDKQKDNNRFGQLIGLVKSEKGANPKVNQTQGGNGVGTSGGEEMQFEEADLDIQYQHVQKALRMAAESVNRDLELAPPAEVSKDAKSFLDVIITHMGHKYIDIALEDAIASSLNQKTEDISYLQVISMASHAVQLTATFVKTVILSMVNGSGNVQKTMITEMNKYVAGVETKLNTILQNTVDVVLSQLGTVLADQKKKDFSPREDTPRVERTEVSERIARFLDNLYSIAQDALDGRNIHTFLIEIGVGFRDLMMEHLKKHTISVAGADTLMGDLQLYQETIDNWSIGELSESFSILHAIGNLYVAQPQAVPSLLRQSNLSQLKPYVIREYLSKRVDYYSNSINKMVSSGGGGGTGTRARTATSGASSPTSYYPAAQSALRHHHTVVPHVM